MTLQVWKNGVMRPLDRVHVACNDRGLLLGDGLFETMRAEDGGVPMWDRHMARLRTSLNLLDLTLDWDDTILREAMRETLVVNGLTDASVRLTVTRGSGPRGLAPPETPTPTVLISAGLAKRAAGEVLPPVRLTVSDIRRNEGSPISRLKVLGYLDNILAAQGARAKGYDDALLVNNAGRLACATAANVFLSVDGGLVTPPVTDGVLPGIMRGRVLDRCAAEGFACTERSLTLDDIAEAQAVFLTNSLIGIRMVSEIDGHAYDGALPEVLSALL